MSDYNKYVTAVNKIFEVASQIEILRWVHAVFACSGTVLQLLQLFR